MALAFRGRFFVRNFEVNGSIQVNRNRNNSSEYQNETLNARTTYLSNCNISAQSTRVTIILVSNTWAMLLDSGSFSVTPDFPALSLSGRDFITSSITLSGTCNSC